MKILQMIVLIAGVVTLGGCAHNGPVRAVFIQDNQLPPPAEGGPLVVKITRHVDTIVNGPDIEEDQRLVLNLTRVEVGKKILIPSPTVAARFVATRFGPTSTGQQFQGYVLVKSVSETHVVIKLDLDVVAKTVSGGYTHHAKFSDTYTCLRKDVEQPDSP